MNNWMKFGITLFLLLVISGVYLLTTHSIFEILGCEWELHHRATNMQQCGANENCEVKYDWSIDYGFAVFQNSTNSRFKACQGIDGSVIVVLLLMSASISCFVVGMLKSALKKTSLMILVFVAGTLIAFEITYVLLILAANVAAPGLL